MRIKLDFSTTLSLLIKELGRWLKGLGAFLACAGSEVQSIPNIRLNLNQGISETPKARKRLLVRAESQAAQTAEWVG